MGFDEPVAGPTISDAPSIEPSTGASVEAPPRPRGRPRSGGMSQKNISGIEAMLLAIHNSLKASTHIEECGLSPEEARELVNSYNEVCIYYPAAQLPAHIAALIGFCSAVTVTYGSRIAAYRLRKSMQPRPPARPGQPGQAPGPAPAARPAAMNGHGAAPAQPPPSAFTPAPAPPVERPPAPGEPVPVRMRTGHIEGVGEVVFDENDPLLKGGKLN